MNKKLNKKTGNQGERLAEQLLCNKGYELVERNFSNKFGEIDLIFMDGDVLVFVEVKTKVGVKYGTPEEMFGRGKYNQVKRMATMYLNGKSVRCRIDMVAVVIEEDGQAKIKHYENVVF